MEIEEIEPCCGTCRFHYYKREVNDYSCINKESDFYTESTDGSECCDEWRLSHGLANP